MNWPVVPLKMVTSVITKGTTPTTLGKSYSNSGIPFLRAENLQNGTIELNGNLLFIDDETHELLARSAIFPQDVLISIAGTIGRVGVVPDDLPPMNCNQAVAIIRPLAVLRSRFLMYWLLGWEAKGQISNSKVTQTISNLSLGQISNFGVPLPAASEQSRIVELLDEADRLRRLSCKADTKAVHILPALFLKMFGDPTANPMGWPIGTLGDLLNSTDYGTSTRASDDGLGVPLIRMGNVSYEGNLVLKDLKYVELPESETAKFRLANGDILFNRTNSKELVGKTGLWDVDMDAVLASYFIRLRVNPKQADPVFLWAFMNSAHMKRVLRATARGAIGQANINTSELRATPMYKPPLPIQELFAKKVAAIRSALKVSSEWKNLEDLFALMLQRSFSGQLTAKWREAHMKELLAEMELQGRQLNSRMLQEAAV